jgi:TetR/AcrR family transcriptional regulator, ethionamide resistance regulator
VSSLAQRPRRRQPREETRGQILDAASEFLAEHSFRELNVDTLMARTGHTRTLFYQHFDGIPALLLALTEVFGAELGELAQSWSRTDRVGPDVARQRLAGFVAFQRRNAAVLRAMAEAAHHHSVIEDARRSMIEGFIGITAAAIQQRIDSGELQPLDAPEIARALVWMLNGYLLDPRHTDDGDRALEALWTVWTRTLFPGSAA